jgi:hypothetical protein
MANLFSGEPSTHLGNTNISGHKWVISANSTHGFLIATSVPLSWQDRWTSIHTLTQLVCNLVCCPLVLRSKSSELLTLFDQELDQDEEGMYSRSTWTNKCCKPEARKGKGSSVPTPQPYIPGSPVNDTLKLLATACNSTSSAMTSSPSSPATATVALTACQLKQ